MKKQLSLFLLFFLTVHAGYTQYISINGTIQSKEDTVSVEFAHIYVKNSTIGTYTNSQGQFTLNYPDTLANDTLLISRIGYHSYSLPLSKVMLNDTLKVYLNESAMNLKEVVIKDNRDSVAAIVKKVLKYIRKNYPTRIHYLEGFYRDMSLKGTTYTRLIEASVGVTENSYSKENTHTKVKIRQLRKSEDYREYSFKHQLYEIAMWKMAKAAWDLEWNNNIYKLLNMNYPKVNKKKITIWAKEYNFIEAFEFEITDVSEADSTAYYHINFQMPPESSGAFAYFGGQMVINMEDMAIVEWKYGMISHPYKTFSNQQSFFFEGKFHNQNHIIYSKIGDKYYPTFFEKLAPSGKGTTQHVDKESGKKSFQYDKVTFMINRVVTKKREFDRIKKRDALDNELDLYDTEQKYDSTFWDNYNILLLDPLLESAKQDLEKETTLKEQFKKNGE